MARVTDRPILIVSHGWPSKPMQQERAVRHLAERIQRLTPGVTVRGGTLAAEGALKRAVEGLQNPIVCPWFMSDGWFVATCLPKRLRAAGLSEWTATAPLGMMPGIHPLMAERVAAHLRARDLDATETTLLLAAHGSPSSDRPRLATEAAAQALRRATGLARVLPCYIDEAPAIRDLAREHRQALVLPFFAARAGHVTEDLPEDLSAAGFSGELLDPVGCWSETPAMVVEAIAKLSSEQVA